MEESIWTREKGRTSRAEARERRKQKSYWGLVWGEVFSVTTMTMSGFYKGALVFSALAGFALAFLCPPHLGLPGPWTAPLAPSLLTGRSERRQVVHGQLEEREMEQN